MSTALKFFVSWSGEPGAGINPGYEEITVTFKHGQPIDHDVEEFWRDSVEDFYDNATVEVAEVIEDESPKQVQTSGPQCKNCRAFTTYARVSSHGLCMACENAMGFILEK